MTCDIQLAVSLFTDHTPLVVGAEWVGLTYPTLLADGSVLVISLENFRTD